MFNMVSRDVNASKKLVRFPTDIYLPGASGLGNLATKMCQKYTVVIVFLVGFFSSSFVRVHVSPGFSSVEQENN